MNILIIEDEKNLADLIKDSKNVTLVLHKIETFNKY